MTETKPSLPYRPDIDGLRAVAVLSVIAFHASKRISGGFVGVAGKRDLTSFDHAHLTKAASEFLIDLNIEKIFGN